MRAEDTGDGWAVLPDPRTLVCPECHITHEIAFTGSGYRTVEDYNRDIDQWVHPWHWPDHPIIPRIDPVPRFTAALDALHMVGAVGAGLIVKSSSVVRRAVLR